MGTPEVKKKVVACIIARTVSQRLPLKIFRDIGDGNSMIDFLIKRVLSVSSIDKVFICTSAEEVDDILEDVAAKHGIEIYRGSADAVIERMLAVGKIENADVVLRITGDNPFTAIEFIPAQVDFLIENNLDYVRVTDVPVGATAEVICYDALIKCNHLMDPAVSEYMMLYLFEPKNFRCGVIKPFQTDLSVFSLTVDTKQDLIRSRKLLQEFVNVPPENIFLKDVMAKIQNQQFNIPYALVKTTGGKVKLPYGEEISFEAFTADMERRKKDAITLNLVCDE